MFYKLDPPQYFKTRMRRYYFELLYEATQVWTVQKEPDEQQVAVKLPFIKGVFLATKEELVHKTREAWYWTDKGVLDKDYLFEFFTYDARLKKLTTLQAMQFYATSPFEALVTRQQELLKTQRDHPGDLPNDFPTLAPEPRVAREW
jgi:hypothetical protein